MPASQVQCGFPRLRMGLGGRIQDENASLAGSWNPQAYAWGWAEQRIESTGVTDRITFEQIWRRRLIVRKAARLKLGTEFHRILDTVGAAVDASSA